MKNLLLFSLALLFAVADVLGQTQPAAKPTAPATQTTAKATQPATESKTISPNTSAKPSLPTPPSAKPTGAQPTAGQANTSTKPTTAVTPSAKPAGAQPTTGQATTGAKPQPQSPYAKTTGTKPQSAYAPKPAGQTAATPTSAAKPVTGTPGAKPQPQSAYTKTASPAPNTANTKPADDDDYNGIFDDDELVLVAKSINTKGAKPGASKTAISAEDAEITDEFDIMKEDMLSDDMDADLMNIGGDADDIDLQSVEDTSFEDALLKD